MKKRVSGKRQLFFTSNHFVMIERNLPGITARIGARPSFRKTLALLFSVFCFPLLMYASHFRYGSISWINSSGNTVVFKISEAWRGDAFGAFPSVGQVINIGGDGIFNYGDGTTGQIILTVTSVNLSENWFYGEATLTKTYAAPGTYTAFSATCCRIGGLQNNSGGNFRIQSTVNVGSGNSSPVSSIVPIVDVPANNAAAAFTIPASDPNGSTLSFALSTSVEAGNPFAQPLGLSVNGATGQVTFNTVGTVVGQLYTTQVKISDGVAIVPVDFIIRISGTTGTPPFFDYPPTPANGSVLNVAPGTPLNFTVSARDNDAGNTVTLSVAGAPVGSVFTPLLPASGNPVSSSFSWTPTMANLGNFVLNFNAQDNTLQSASTSLTIVVALPNVYYSKAAGDLHNVLTWGVNPDGSGANPTDFGSGKTFQLANRPGIYTMTADWTVAGTVNIPAASELRISGFTFSIASLAGVGTISGSSTSNLVVTGTGGGNIDLRFTSTARQLNNFTVNRSGSLAAATLLTQLDVLNVLTLTSGTLNTGGLLTLKSSATNTARVAPVMAGAGISGAVTVERYIPARRAWRMLSAPTSGAQTILQGWQEGAAPNTDPNPGYGTHITGGPVFGAPANGFDQNPGAQSSIKYHNGTSWLALPNTNATTVGTIPYMLFVRGHRSIPIGLNTVPADITTLRTMGNLNVGDQMYAVGSANFTAIPNPFASPINFATITRSNVPDNFYVWDPKMGSVGAYVNVSFNGVSYDVTPASVSPMSQYIQSGQAFLVQSTGAAGSVTIKESDKVATAAQDVFRRSTTAQGINITLKASGDDNEMQVLDEVYVSFNNRFAAAIDAFDALKPANIEENLAVISHDKELMVERRPLVTDKEAIQLSLTNVTQRTYQFEFNAQRMAETGLYAVLEDRYTGATTVIDLQNTTQVSFTVSSDVASASATRFALRFSKEKPIQNAITGAEGIRVYPNPVSGRELQLSFNNVSEGVYRINMINALGQLVYTTQIRHNGGTVLQKLSMRQPLSKGVYQLQIDGNNKRQTLKIVSE